MHLAKIKKRKSQLMNLFIFSAYHLNDAKEQIFFNSFISFTYESILSSYFMASGQDFNASIGSNNEKKLQHW